MLGAATSTTNPDGGRTWDDGAGGSAVTDVTGELTSVSPNLGKPAAWLQTPVYIAAGAGLVLGALAALVARKKKR